MASQIQVKVRKASTKQPTDVRTPSGRSLPW